MRSLVVACFLALCMRVALAAELPGDSLYRLEIPLQTADGTTVALPALRGKPLLITLFYSQCASVCPIVTAQLQNIDRHLTPIARHNLAILMVSLDSDRDSPQALESFRQQHHIDDPRWIVARASAADVRLLAAVLGVRYRELPDQSFNHSAVITLLDRDGAIKARAEGIRAADGAFLQKVQAIAAGAETSPRDRERARPR